MLFNYVKKNFVIWNRTSSLKATDTKLRYGRQKRDARTVMENKVLCEEESQQIQAIFRRNKLKPRDQFGTLSKLRLNQPEPIHKGFQPDLWSQGNEMIRIVKERQKTLRERLDDEFAKERALQITEPLYVTVKHALRKDERLRKWREEKKLALDAGLPMPPPPKVADGIIKAQRRKMRKQDTTLLLSNQIVSQ